MSWLPFLGNPGEPESLETSEIPKLTDPDEIRRRRLASIEASQTLVSSIPVETDVVKNTLISKRERQEYEASTTYQSPLEVSNDSIKAETPAVPKNSSPSPKKSASASDFNNRSLNRTLEEVLLISLRKDCEGQIRYVGMVDQPDGLLNSSNISENICGLLISSLEQGGAIGYLGSCYKRLVQKETVANEQIREELGKCKQQLVSFMATALSEDGPEVFGANAERSDQDFLRLLTSGDTTASAHTPALLKELAEELHKQDQLGPVVQKLARLAHDSMATPTFPASPFTMMRTPVIKRTVVEDVPASFLALVSFCQADKRVAKALTSFPDLLLQEAKANPSIRPPDIMQAQMLHGQQFVERAGVLGAAWEFHTLLGRVLTLAPHADSPAMMKHFKDVHKQPRNVLESKLSIARKNSFLVQSSVESFLMSLLKGGGEAKDLALKILRQALMVNIEAGKDRPSPLASSSRGCLVNLCGVLLRICRPILKDSTKIGKIDWNYFLDARSATWTVFPVDETKLVTGEDNIRALSGEGDDDQSESETSELNFISQSFFLCWRALHLGIVQEALGYPTYLRALNRFQDDLRNDGQEALYWVARKLCADVMMLAPEILGDCAAFCACACSSLLAALTARDPGAMDVEQDSQGSWVASPSTLSRSAKQILKVIPEHLLSDVLELILFISKTDPMQFHTCNMKDVLSLLLFFLRRPWALTSPHLRALLGEIIFLVFLPSSENRKGEIYVYPEPPPAAFSGPHTTLLESLPEAQNFLAPSLLLLYGDVEKTGFYDKLSHRRSIMVCLQHLWSLSSHRAAFRSIANTSNQDAPEDGQSGYFIRFANGLMNETNTLVDTTMEKLTAIRQTQQQMASPEWSALNQERREEIVSQHQDNENHVRFMANLCFETFTMFVYLTSDEVIREPFLTPEILPRYTSLVMSTLGKLAGPRALEIKVENMESYNFRPKEMLRLVCLAITHFAGYEKFWKAIAADGYYQDGMPLRKALATLKKLNSLSPAEVKDMEILVDHVIDARTEAVVMETIISNAPDEFLDPIVGTLMRNPVTLPTSGNVMDKSTISQILLNSESDPFNRTPLKLSDVVPNDDLRQRIDEWIEGKKREYQSTQEMEMAGKA